MSSTIPQDSHKGYKGHALDFLKRFQVSVWSDIEVESTRGNFTGIILPRSETADDKHIVLKLRNGYNVGLAVGALRLGARARRHLQHRDGEALRRLQREHGTRAVDRHGERDRARDR